MNPEAKSNREARKKKQMEELAEAAAYFNGDYSTPQAIEAAWNAGILNPPDVPQCPNCRRVGCQLGYIKGHPIRGLPGGICAFHISQFARFGHAESASKYPLTVDEFMWKFYKRSLSQLRLATFHLSESEQAAYVQREIENRFRE